jgi:hypothetical protein
VLFRNRVNWAHGTITVHAFIHRTCIATSWQKTNNIISNRFAKKL